MSEAKEYLMGARCKCITSFPFYGAVASMFTWKEDPTVPFMGVRIMTGGLVECIYNDEMCDIVGKSEDGISILMEIIKHEIEHIIRMHLNRIGSREPRLWNIVTDMIINGPSRQPNLPELKKLESKVGCQLIWMQEDVNSNISAEELYDKLDRYRIEFEMWKIKKQGAKCPTCGNQNNKQADKSKDQKQPSQSGKPEDQKDKGDKDQGDQGGQQGQGGQEGQQEQNGQGNQQQGNQQGKGQNQGSGKGGACPDCGGCGNSGNKGSGSGKELADFFEKENVVIGDKDSKQVYKIKGMMVDDHDTWNQSNCSDDEAAQSIKGMIEQAAGICAGKTPSHIEDILKELTKPKVKWRSILRHFIGRKIGGKRKTYSRIHRRAENPFGKKGVSSHAHIPLTVMVDTSGSISELFLKQFFAEIESMAQLFKITVIEFTAAVNKCYKYKKGMWKSITIYDRGGTNFEAALTYIETNKCVGKVNIILTDGEDACPKERKLDLIWAICPHSDDRFNDIKKNLNWGEHVHISRKGI